jgi:mannose-6-phosphate isomerase-like protein (cupin superfamily)
MYVIDQPAPAETPLPGLRHATWAANAEGLTSLSLWRQSIAAGCATPPHAHACDELVMCLSGHGEVHIDGRIHAFHANQTVVLPAGQPHQIINIGAEPLELTAVFSATPVPVTAPDGTELPLPWRT